jgi:hypothetical protein
MLATRPYRAAVQPLVDLARVTDAPDDKDAAAAALAELQNLAPQVHEPDCATCSHVHARACSWS